MYMYVYLKNRSWSSFYSNILLKKVILYMYMYMYMYIFLTPSHFTQASTVHCNCIHYIQEVNVLNEQVFHIHDPTNVIYMCMYRNRLCKPPPRVRNQILHVVSRRAKSSISIRSTFQERQKTRNVRFRKKCLWLPQIHGISSQNCKLGLMYILDVLQYWFYANTIWIIWSIIAILEIGNIFLGYKFQFFKEFPWH